MVSSRTRLFITLLVLFLCSNGSAGEDHSNKLRVLFIGNSLTYTNDLPAIVEALARAERKSFISKSIAFPDFSLEDHWNQGDARKAISEGRWDIVVLQQGPSALPESRVLLRDYVRRFTSEIRRAGAKPALYMVWPSVGRQRDFDRVIESYKLAAEDVDAMLLPVGAAWVAACKRDPRIALYSGDGFHPTVLGSYLAALVVYEELCDASPERLPRKLKIRSSALDHIKQTAQELETIRLAARETIGQFRRR